MTNVIVLCSSNALWGCSSRLTISTNVSGSGSDWLPAQISLISPFSRLRRAVSSWDLCWNSLSAIS